MLHNDLLKLRRLLEDILKVLLRTMNLYENRLIPSEVQQVNPEISQPMQVELLGTQEVLKLLNISESTYYRLVKNGSLIPTKIGSRHYYRKNDLDTIFELFRRKKMSTKKRVHLHSFFLFLDFFQTGHFFVF
ncbi:helix-turn-helix domain-containing protein [Sphingobacterium sp. 1.A.4]|uniref:helix-turn-helix domain-containing protein n=1 Tax=Sphingobacterium sp. 1.A.4 TaxID=2044603 RepID=UPI000C0BC44A